MVGSLWRDQRAALVLTGLAAVAALAWIVVGVVTPTRGVVLIGPVDSGRLRIFLVGAAATAAAAAVVLVLLRQARRRGTAAAVACGLGVVAVATGWFATCAMCLAVSVFEPSYERVAVPGGCPAVVVQLAEGPLIANDITHVVVLSGVGSTFRPVPPRRATGRHVRPAPRGPHRRADPGRPRPALPGFRRRRGGGRTSDPVRGRLPSCRPGRRATL
ncbi:MAG: hypothetical protein PGN15_15470 [Aeromicrobium erythreum]